MYKIIGADLKEYGRISADQLRQWISENRVNGETKVQAEGTTAWKRVAELPEFAGALPPALPPPPPPPLNAPPAPAPVTLAPAQVKSNQLATWALITGIISMIPCCCYTGLLPIILGGIALSQIKNHPPQTGSGFAITGIVLGIIALIMLLVGLAVTVAFPQNFTNLMNSLPQ